MKDKACCKDKNIKCTCNEHKTITILLGEVNDRQLNDYCNKACLDKHPKIIYYTKEGEIGSKIITKKDIDAFFNKTE